MRMAEKSGIYGQRQEGFGCDYKTLGPGEQICRSGAHCQSAKGARWMGPSKQANLDGVFLWENNVSERLRSVLT